MNKSIKMRLFPTTTNSPLLLAASSTLIYFFVVVLFSAILLATAGATAAADRPKISLSELTELLVDIRGDDNRLVRWDAAPDTAEKQKQADGKHCGDKMLSVADLLFDKSSNTKTKQDACLYLTFCVTDNPDGRAVLERYHDDDRLHKKIVELVKSNDAGLSAAASHVIYILSYANEYHHQGLYHAGAIDALGGVVKNSNNKAQADQVMWAAAALQNLAASYCENSPNKDGRCYWTWDDHDHYVPQIVDDYLPVFADGTSARKVIANDLQLMNKLIELSCVSPIVGDQGTDDNPFPGYNAVIGKHESHPNIIGWSAIGCLKNVALEPESHELLDSKALNCFCSHMLLGNDWLEQQKGQEAIQHFRYDEPCWFRHEQQEMCSDKRFLTADNYHCADLVEHKEHNECKDKNAVDAKTGMKATEACCECGGGITVKIPPELIAQYDAEEMYYDPDHDYLDEEHGDYHELDDEYDEDEHEGYDLEDDDYHYDHDEVDDDYVGDEL